MPDEQIACCFGDEKYHDERGSGDVSAYVYDHIQFP